MDFKLLELGLLVLIWEVLWIIVLSILNRFAPKTIDRIVKAPLLDIVIISMILLPTTGGFIVGGSWGLAFSVAALLISFIGFSILHSLYNKHFRSGKPSVLRQALSEAVGSYRLLVGVWLTLLAAPIFLVIRLGQILVYPLFQFVLGFPKYNSSDWIQLSRHKFSGLVGLDLLACLYCEWAAGIYALGAEMLRNHESFWCPIRFRDDKHCENCKLEFPDLDKWVAPTASVEDAAARIRQYYPKTASAPRSWYGHSSRKSKPPV